MKVKSSISRQRTGGTRDTGHGPASGKFTSLDHLSSCPKRVPVGMCTVSPVVWRASAANLDPRLLPTLR